MPGLPARDYRIQLEAYAGPLDLLLYLVKRNEIDLHDIPIAELTDQYLTHLTLIKQIDMDSAGEFLVMAATLLEIKSQMILPRPDQPDQADDDAQHPGGQDPADPRHELVQQLLAYKRYKDAARRLQDQHEQWHARHPAHAKAARDQPAGDEENAPAREIDLEDVNLMDLCEAFGRLLDSIGHKADHQITYDDTPISLHAADIYDRLEREGPMTLQQIFVGRAGRSEMIGLFLAALELVRDKRIRVVQEKIAGEIRLQATPAQDAADDDRHDEKETDWRDPETGQMQYDWPDEQSRLRAQRREQLREKWKNSGRPEQPEDDALDEEPPEADDATPGEDDTPGNA